MKLIDQYAKFVSVQTAIVFLVLDALLCGFSAGFATMAAANPHNSVWVWVLLASTSGIGVVQGTLVVLQKLRLRASSPD